MKIIENGKYPEENVKVCPECSCKFAYFDNEIHHEYISEDMAKFCGLEAYGSYDYVVCPTCKYQIIFNVCKENFTELTFWIDTIKNFFLKIKNKIKGEKEGK